jgi:hypothetical protein
MSKDDFNFLCDLCDKADEEIKRKMAFSHDDFGLYINFLDRQEDALKAKIQTVSDSKEDAFEVLERIKRIKKVMIDEAIERG